jgi:hypothetical protein
MQVRQSASDAPRAELKIVMRRSISITKIHSDNLPFLTTLQTAVSFDSCVDYAKIQGDGINNFIGLRIVPAIKIASFCSLLFVNTVSEPKAERLTISRP